MHPKKIGVAAMLLTAVFSAQAASTYQLRVAAPGMRATIDLPPETPVVIPPPPPVDMSPKVAISPTQWDFGAVPSGQPAYTAFILANSGKSQAALSLGELSGPFSVASTDCASTLAPEASCTVTVGYQRDVPGAVDNATLSVVVEGAESLNAEIAAETAHMVSALTQGVSGLTYSNEGATVTWAGSSPAQVAFVSSKSSGQWYWEAQSSAGQGSLSTVLGSGGYFLDLRSVNRGTWGTGVGPTGTVALKGATNNRYGFAVDIPGRTMTVVDVATCAKIVTATWSKPGAVHPLFDFRSIDKATSITGYFAQSGKTCIPAGYRWWSRD